jgi:hypothetical protein
MVKGLHYEDLPLLAAEVAKLPAFLDARAGPQPHPAAALDGEVGRATELARVVRKPLRELLRNSRAWSGIWSDAEYTGLEPLRIRQRSRRRRRDSNPWSACTIGGFQNS